MEASYWEEDRNDYCLLHGLIDRQGRQTQVPRRANG